MCVYVCSCLRVCVCVCVGVCAWFAVLHRDNITYTGRTVLLLNLSHVCYRFKTVRSAVTNLEILINF